MRIDQEDVVGRCAIAVVAVVICIGYLKMKNITKFAMIIKCNIDAVAMTALKLCMHCKTYVNNV